MAFLWEPDNIVVKGKDPAATESTIAMVGQVVCDIGRLQPNSSQSWSFLTSTKVQLRILNSHTKKDFFFLGLSLPKIGDTFLPQNSLHIRLLTAIVLCEL